MPLAEGQTVRIKIVEAASEREGGSGEEEDLLAIPSLLERGRSRSEDYSCPTTELEVQTGTLEVTQEFLYNSGIELAPRKPSPLDEIQRELAINAKRLKINE